MPLEGVPQGWGRRPLPRAGWHRQAARACLCRYPRLESVPESCAHRLGAALFCKTSSADGCLWSGAVPSAPLGGRAPCPHTLSTDYPVSVPYTRPTAVVHTAPMLRLACVLPCRRVRLGRCIMMMPVGLGPAQHRLRVSEPSISLAAGYMTIAARPGRPHSGFKGKMQGGGKKEENAFC